MQKQPYLESQNPVFNRLFVAEIVPKRVRKYAVPLHSQSLT